MSQDPSKPSEGPIAILNTTAARNYTHMHPLLVGSLYAYQWSAIVADPVPALTHTLAGLAGLQMAYVAICLPPTGSAAITKDKKRSFDTKGEKKKKRAAGAGSIVDRFVPAIVSLVAALVLFTLPVFGVLVLFGAPILTHRILTLLCAAHITLLATMPLVYVHGLDAQAFKSILALLRPIDEVHGAMLGTLVGAWLGAVPIPLDWDREWQKWPITIVTGAYLGYAVGKFLGGSILKGKKISFEA